MKLIKFALVTSLFLVGYSPAQSTASFKVPTFKITGAENKLQAGELAQFTPEFGSAEGLQKTTVSWALYTINDKLSLTKKQFKVDKSDQSIYFGTGVKSQKLIVLAQAHYLFSEKDKDNKIVRYDALSSPLIQLEVEIQGIEPPVPPKPPDPPVPVVTEKWGPQPNLDAGKYGLSAKAFNWVTGAGWGTLKKSDVLKVAQSRAVKLDELIAMIGAGAYNAPLTTNFDEGFKLILVELKTRNEAVLAQNGQSAQQWNDYIVAWQDYVYGVYSGGSLSTKEDIMRVFDETSKGLKALSVIKN